MIYGAAHLREDVTLEADVCVIGTGAGGAPVLWECARRGLRAVAVEAGSFLTPRDFTQLEHEMFPKLYHESAGRATRDKAIHVHQGKGVGGSTLHNLNLCARVAAPVLNDWRERFTWKGLGEAEMAALYDDAERLLHVSTVTEAQLSAGSRVLRRGCTALGYHGGNLRHNRRGCQGSGFCELGCPFDAKENALKVFVTPAVEAGALVLADTWAERLEWSGRRAERLHAVSIDPKTGKDLGRVTIAAKRFCLSASATGTPTLLRRSGIPDPHALVGSRLHLHPGAAVAGLFEAPQQAWQGIPQGYECTQWLDHTPGSPHRVWIIPAFAHPAGTASILSAFGPEHARILAHYDRTIALTPMLHDESCGRVAPKGRFGVTLDYDLCPADRTALALGLRECAKLLLAAGAHSVLVPFAETAWVRGFGEADALADWRYRPHDLELQAVHPMSTCWLGDDPRTACVATDGRYHHLDNLFVADTSLFPSSTGGPPQLTAFALGLHVGRRVAAG